MNVTSGEKKIPLNYFRAYILTTIPEGDRCKCYVAHPWERGKLFPQYKGICPEGACVRSLYQTMRGKGIPTQKTNTKAAIHTWGEEAAYPQPQLHLFYHQTGVLGKNPQEPECFVVVSKLNSSGTFVWMLE